MRINSVRLVNYRGFADRTFEFGAAFNVLAGSNGSGKTSVLKGVSEAMSGLVNAIPNTPHIVPLSDENDVRMEIVVQQERYRFERRWPIEVHAQGKMLDQDVGWSVSRHSALQNSTMGGRLPGQLIVEASRLLPAQGTAPVSQDLSLPLVAFYRASRHWNQPQTSEIVAATTQNSRADGYAMWSDASVDGARLQSWAIAKSLERAQGASEKGTTFNAVSDDELGQVNLALSAVLEEAKGIYYDLRQKALLIEWKSRTNGTLKATPFGNLSDGQRALVGLVVDIARRMCLLNPHLGEDVTRKTSGVVLIDELDIHLHPQWQRAITRGLKMAFPCVQFIAASHSPQILSELEPHEIVLLTADGTEHPKASYGLDSSRVLEEVMGAAPRPVEVARLLSEVFEALERNDLSTAQLGRERLQQLSPELPELQRISALMTRKAALKK
jgi:predicted ATP-binding protein involved in virulence